MARGCVPVGLFVAMLVLCGCSSSFQRVDLGDCRIVVLPAEQPVAGSSEWMTSAGMRALLQAIRRDFQPWTVLVGLPPVLTATPSLRFFRRSIARSWSPPPQISARRHRGGRAASHIHPCRAAGDQPGAGGRDAISLSVTRIARRQSVEMLLNYNGL